MIFCCVIAESISIFARNFAHDLCWHHLCWHEKSVPRTIHQLRSMLSTLIQATSVLAFSDVAAACLLRYPDFKRAVEGTIHELVENEGNFVAMMT